MKKALIPSLLVMTVLLFGIMLAFLLYYFMPPKQAQPKFSPEISHDANNNLSPAPFSQSPLNKNSLKDIIKKTQHKVVQIEAGNSTGSGFLYNANGDIVTNAHVVGYEREVIIKDSDKQEYYGEVIGRSESTDVALIRVPDLEHRSPLRIKSGTAELGDEVLALGSPLGMQNTVTTGIISGLDRTFFLDPFNYENMYQITAPISPGNSGGPIVSGIDGSVLGINSVKHLTENIGFSIPIYTVITMLDEWSANPMNLNNYEEHYVYEHPEYDGEITEDYSEEYGTDEEVVIEEEYPEEFPEEDSTYDDLRNDPLATVIDYYSYINNQDYELAYHLIGGNWKASSPSLENFAKGYENTLTIRILEQSVSTNEDGTYKVTLTTEADEYVNDSYRTSTYHFSYIVGPEEGMLKLLGGEMY